MAPPKTQAPADAPITSALTTPQQVRLECVKLAYRHDRPPSDVVAKAADLERYVLDGQTAPVQTGNGGQVEPEHHPV